MRSLPLRLAAVVVAAAALSACADPSGVAGSDAVAGAAADASLRRVAPPAPGTGTVYVVHGIVGTDLDAALPAALPVDVEVNGACVLPGFTFGTIAGPLALPAGSHDVAVRLANADAPCTGAVAIAAPGVMLPAGANVSIVAHLTAAGAPTASVWVNDLRRVPGRALVEPRHAAAAPAVDVLVDGVVAFAGVPNGADAQPAAIRPGRHELAVNVAGTSTTVLEATLDPRPFTFTAVYVVGTPGSSLQPIVQVIPIDPAR